MIHAGSPGTPRATVLIPTFGHAPFLRWAIASAQAQTVRELEICVILDGSPPSMKEMVDGLSAEDGRIRSFYYPKAGRTGEVHRDKVLAQTTGGIVCYLSHDDLWLSGHVAAMEDRLAELDFTHTLHIEAGLGDAFGEVVAMYPCDLTAPETRSAMLDQERPRNFFGLTFGAHTREAYAKLPEGWAATPDGVPTDLHMWRKFLSTPGIRIGTTMCATALHFPAPCWSARFSADEYGAELERYLPLLKAPAFRERLGRHAYGTVVARMQQAEAQLTECLARERAHPELLAAEVNRRIRTLPARTIWKLVWKRLTRQWGGGR